MCVSLSDLISDLENVLVTEGDMSVEIGDLTGTEFFGIGSLVLDKCDCCQDNILSVHPCSCNEEEFQVDPGQPPTYIEVDFLGNNPEFGSQN